MRGKQPPRLVELTVLCHTDATLRELGRAPLLELRLYETTMHQGEGQRIPLLEVVGAVQLRRPSQKAADQKKISPRAGRKPQPIPDDRPPD